MSRLGSAFGEGKRHMVIGKPEEEQKGDCHSGGLRQLPRTATCTAFDKLSRGFGCPAVNYSQSGWSGA